jgi:hypothetical protein
MGQFLPVFLQFGLSAANVTVQIAAAKIENRIFVQVFIGFYFVRDIIWALAKQTKNARSEKRFEHFRVWVDRRRSSEAEMICAVMESKCK